MCPLTYICGPCKQIQSESDEFIVALAKWRVCMYCGEPNPNANNREAIREATKDMPMWIMTG